jgi:hypothetical protein
MTGYEAFSLYNALKLHFSSKSYDFFKYHGKSNISIESFENRKDKYHFYKLSRQNDKDDYIEFLVSNFLIREKLWAGDLLQEEAIIAYKKRMATIQSLGYIFKNDCQILSDSVESPNELLEVKDGEYPKLLIMTLQKDTHFETLCILNSLMNFLPMWDRKITDTIRYPEFSMKVKKYMPFLEFDKEKFREIATKELL